MRDVLLEELQFSVAVVLSREEAASRFRVFGDDGEWVILRGTIAPHGHILDEVELEVRLKVRALDTGPLIRMTTRQ